MSNDAKREKPFCISPIAGGCYRRVLPFIYLHMIIRVQPDKCSHLSRERTDNPHFCPREGFDRRDGNLFAVESLGADLCVMSTIQGISGQWVADVGHMHPNLMGAAGLQLTGNQRVAVCAAKHFKMCDRPLCLRVRKVYFSGDNRAGDTDQRSVYAAFILLDGSFRDSVIDLLQFSHQHAGCKGVFGGDDNTGGISVQPV